MGESGRFRGRRFTRRRVWRGSAAGDKQKSRQGQAEYEREARVVGFHSQSARTLPEPQGHYKSRSDLIWRPRSDSPQWFQGARLRRIRAGEKGRNAFARVGAGLCLGWACLALPALAAIGDGPSGVTPEWLAGLEVDPALQSSAQSVLAHPGALLRQARQAADDQRHPEALWLLEQLIQRHPVVADYGASLQVEIMQSEGRDEGVVEVARQALARDPATPLAAELQESLGDALIAQGYPEAARRAWRKALDESRDEALRSRVLLSIASAEEAAGMNDEAATTYRLLWYSYPTRPESEVASDRLARLSVLLGRPLRDGTAWRRRGDRLYRKRLNEEALAAYEEASRLGVSPSETRAMERQKARALFRLRRYPEAVKAFAALPQQDDVPIWYARSLARAGRVPESIEAFEVLARTGPRSLAPRARFLAATLLEGRDFKERARQHYMELAERGRRSSFTDAALWRLGWMAYKEKKNSEAVRYFDQLIGRSEPESTDLLRARYWRARALERSGSSEGSRELSELARTFPFSYYGWRAQMRGGVGEIGPRPVRTGLVESPGLLSPDSFRRARILLEAGMQPEARNEIARHVGRVRRLGDRLQLAQLATDAEDYHQAQRLVVDAYSGELAKGPMPRLEDLWWYAWPSAFSQDVGRATEAEGRVEPALVYSIMREESGYRPEVISPVGARGLLQIMTATGEGLAQRRGLESFEAEDLFVPSTNIALGADYLTELSAQFDGRLSASIASYNAGPEAVEEWLAEGATPGAMATDDEWVESIPYEQTRNYVKRVLRSLHVYRMLY